MKATLRPDVVAEFVDPRDARSAAERLARALRARAAAIEEVTAAWYAADCPPAPPEA